jgi:hypothetical protein
MIKILADNFYSSPEEKNELEETVTARKEVTDFLYNHKELESVMLELESLVSVSEAISEYQGFIFGFKYAMELIEKTDKKSPLK